MRSFDEIKKRAQRLSKDDFLGFDTPDLIIRLPYEHASEWLKDDCVASEWDATLASRERADILKEMEDYIEFAFEKAYGERGISASRSVSHYQSWVWLAGDDNLLSEIEGDNWDNYGLGVLTRICVFYGWEIPNN